MQDVISADIVEICSTNRAIRLCNAFVKSDGCVALIQTTPIGEFDSVESLPCRYREQIRSVFQRNGYMIGNSILYPKRICHSFVLMDWTADDKILLYDPWNGAFGFYPSEDVFCRGISSPLGTGVIKWAQYIIEG